MPAGSRLDSVHLPVDRDNVTLEVEGQQVSLTNLRKVFWNDLGCTKRDLLQYYANVAQWLLPHLKDRAMVMKRYPNGATGEFFYMKRAPRPRPDWVRTCTIPHKSSNIIDFPLVQDLPSLLWIVNLGCIDLNPWYARCDDWDRPDFLNFDLDPVPGSDFKQMCEVAVLVRELLDSLKMPAFAKTSGSRGLHVYVPIRRGPVQKEVWGVAKALAFELASRYPKTVTAEYRIAKRPRGRVLVDYNQNAWGRTLASVYSPRPTPHATVSAPVTWEEVERGVTMEQFRLDNVLPRVNRLGDLWQPLLGATRYDLDPLLGVLKVPRRPGRRQSPAA